MIFLIKEIFPKVSKNVFGSISAKYFWLQLLINTPSYLVTYDARWQHVLVHLMLLRALSNILVSKEGIQHLPMLQLQCSSALWQAFIRAYLLAYLLLSRLKMAWLTSLLLLVTI